MSTLVSTLNTDFPSDNHGLRVSSPLSTGQASSQCCPPLSIFLSAPLSWNAGPGAGKLVVTKLQCCSAWPPAEPGVRWALATDTAQAGYKIGRERLLRTENMTPVPVM